MPLRVLLQDDTGMERDDGPTTIFMAQDIMTTGDAIDDKPLPLEDA